MDLKHKVAIVSVASAGIGRELAREFTRHEARVVCAARREQVLNFYLIERNLKHLCNQVDTVWTLWTQFKGLSWFY